MSFSPAKASRLKVTWRQHSEKIKQQEITPDLLVGVATSFTGNSLVPFIGGLLIESGFSPSIQLGPYNQLFQVCLDYKIHFEEKTDVLVLLFRLEDLALNEILEFLQGDASALDSACEKIDELASALQRLRGTFAGSIITGLPPFPTGVPASTSSLENPRVLGHLHRTLCERFLRQTRGIAGIRLCDLDAVQREVGLAASFDARQWYLYRQPYTDAFLSQTGNLLARMIRASRVAPKKCIVLDCDNTLWGGVIGEDGMGGIQLGDEFPGTAFRDFQRLLLYWRQQGIFLALASKNNKADVWEVFEKHSGMVLKREQIAAWQIGWEPKSEGIPKIAQALNIGTDSLVFIDDNPAEIGYMRDARPEVHSILLPEEPADIVETLRGLTLFDSLDVTEEDRQRSDMMQAETQRSQLGSSLSQEDFEKSLQLRLELFRAGDAELERITQLINKTNQFNLTTIRRTLDEVRTLHGSTDHRVYGLRVSDKYGDYGITGVVIADISRAEKNFNLDTLLLSCRVLGRGVEKALLGALAKEAREEGLVTMTASFVATKKNAPAESFLPGQGFQPQAKLGWIIAVDKVPPIAAWIAMVRSNHSAS